MFFMRKASEYFVNSVSGRRYFNRRTAEIQSRRGRKYSRLTGKRKFFILAGELAIIRAIGLALSTGFG
jgi:hypothetical protein